MTDYITRADLDWRMARDYEYRRAAQAETERDALRVRIDRALAVLEEYKFPMEELQDDAHDCLRSVMEALKP